MAWITTFLLVLGAVAALMSLTATIAVLRTSTLTSVQKMGQIVIAWLIPIIGARLIIHLLSEQDIAAIPKRWTPNDTINFYVLSALGASAQAMTRLAGQVIENAIYQEVAEHFSSTSHDVAAGSDSTSGIDSGGSGH